MIKRAVFLFLCLMMLYAIHAQEEATATPSAEITPEAEVTPLVLNPLLNLQIAPPLEITLPEGWQFGYDNLVYEDIDGEIDSVPIAVYRGLIEGTDSAGQSVETTGWIILVWGYDSVIAANPFLPPSGSFNPWLDGQRILRLLVFSNECVIGLAPQREYSIGELEATGTTYSVINCPNDEPDTRGWFAAVNVDGINFAFYLYADPLQGTNSPFEFALQSILDTVVFKVAERLITTEEIEATRQALPTPTATPES